MSYKEKCGQTDGFSLLYISKRYTAYTVINVCYYSSTKTHRELTIYVIEQESHYTLHQQITNHKPQHCVFGCIWKPRLFLSIPNIKYRHTYSPIIDYPVLYVSHLTSHTYINKMAIYECIYQEMHSCRSLNLIITDITELKL